jgi:T5SS/PEP-CTERM-associated repeat protein
MDVVGRPNANFASNGTISIQNGNTSGLLLMGTAVIDGAVLNASSSSAGTGGLITVGEAGDGTPTTVTVETAGSVTAGSVSDTYSILYSDPTSFGELTLMGAGTKWTDAGDPNDTLTTRGYMIIGDNSQASNTPVPPIAGAATLTVTDNATLTETTFARIASSSDSAGMVNVSTGGVWNIGLVTGGFLNVGQSGSGTLNVSSGGTVSVGKVGTFLNNGTTFSGGGMASAIMRAEPALSPYPVGCSAARPESASVGPEPTHWMC